MGALHTSRGKAPAVLQARTDSLYDELHDGFILAFDVVEPRAAAMIALTSPSAQSTGTM